MLRDLKTGLLYTVFSEIGVRSTWKTAGCVYTVNKEEFTKKRRRQRAGHTFHTSCLKGKLFCVSHWQLFLAALGEPSQRKIRAMPKQLVIFHLEGLSGKRKSRSREMSWKKHGGVEWKHHYELVRWKKVRWDATSGYETKFKKMIQEYMQRN